MTCICLCALTQAPANGSGAGDETGHSRLTHKACLERYRKASVAIMTLLRKLTPGVSVNVHKCCQVLKDSNENAAVCLHRSLAQQEGCRAPHLHF